MKRIAVEFRGKTINMSLPEFGVLSAMVAVVDRGDKEPNETESVTLELGGLDTRDSKHLNWGNFELTAGDSVTVTIHDDLLADEPIERTGHSRERDQERERDYVRKKAAEYGWSLDETGNL